MPASETQRQASDQRGHILYNLFIPSPYLPAARRRAARAPAECWLAGAHFVGCGTSENERETEHETKAELAIGRYAPTGRSGPRLSTLTD